MTVLTALCAIFILPDFPETSSGWLTPAEQALAIKRMSEDAGVNINDLDKGHKSGFSLAISDWKVWWLAATLTCMVFSLSYNAYFPTLVSTLGYSSTSTLLLCVPPWIFATVVALALSRYFQALSEVIRSLKLSLDTPITM